MAYPQSRTRSQKLCFVGRCITCQLGQCSISFRCSHPSLITLRLQACVLAPDSCWYSSLQVTLTTCPNLLLNTNGRYDWVIDPAIFDVSRRVRLALSSGLGPTRFAAVVSFFPCTPNLTVADDLDVASGISFTRIISVRACGRRLMPVMFTSVALSVKTCYTPSAAYWDEMAIEMHPVCES